MCIAGEKMGVTEHTPAVEYLKNGWMNKGNWVVMGWIFTYIKMSILCFMCELFNYFALQTSGHSDVNKIYIW